MNRVVVFFAIAVMLFSCGAPKGAEQETAVTNQLEALTNLAKEDSVNSKQNVTESTQSTSARIAKDLNPILIARGSEPGWYAEFYSNKLRLLLNYGKDSLWIEKDFSGINKDKTYNASFSEKNVVTKEEISLNISLTDQSCTEESSGEKREKSIVVKYKNKVYKGCATTKLN